LPPPGTTALRASGDPPPTNFASNVMEIAVPAKNPAGVNGLSDQAKPAVKVALCQVALPCGATAEKVFKNAKITVTPEIDVKAVLTKVMLGEVDAGVVHVTDVRAAGAKVKGIMIPADVNASTLYPIATLTKAPTRPPPRRSPTMSCRPTGPAS
jgi:molybdate transport system substrate-binding protein